jgi:nucleoside-diphosphate-sugar epimerase
MSDIHVVLGTGAIGLALVEELVASGRSVRAVNRSGRAGVPAGVEVCAGDLTDPTFTGAAVADATVIYQCLNPPYHRWAEEFPGLQDAAVGAARAAGARLVSFENTYMYGDTSGEPMTETTPMRAHTRKGKVRAAMAEQLRALHESGDLKVSTARASDYFGPRGTAQSPFGDLVIGAALAGKAARVMGDPDQPHSYTYTVDAARTLAALGSRNDVDGEIFHVPNAPAQTTRQIIDMISEQMGSPIKVSAAPRLVLRALGLFNPTVRELDEMRYEFTQPFIVDSTKAQDRLGIAPTPLPEALQATITWFREQ